MQSTFEEWLEYFEKNRTLSDFLFSSIIKLERVINSRTAYYVSELLEHYKAREICAKDLITQIGSSKKKSSYDGTETWAYITKMTFGEIRRVLNWLWYKGEKEIVRKVIRGYDFLQVHTLERALVPNLPPARK